MATSHLKVVLDTNVFSPQHFETLRGSQFARHCKSGRITPVYSHIFLEETLRAYGAAKKRTELLDQWLPFVTATAKRLCEDFVVIWHRELVQGKGVNADIYMETRKQANFEAGLRRIDADGTWRGWEETEGERNAESAIRDAQKKVSTGIRKEVSEWKHNLGYQVKRHGTVDLEPYFQRELDHAGRMFIHAQVPCSNPQSVADRWSRDKRAYPFFTMFATNMLYISHHAMTRPNEKIDLNAQADLDLMTHLLRADALVSNETGFLRAAFEDLWRPQGKIIFTSEEFATLVNKF